jgi:thiamine biosynthesis protein ThiS
MIRVNDKTDVSWQPGLTVRHLLQALRFTHRHIVVSVDGAIVPRPEYDTYLVPDGADVRVIHIVGGG